MITITEKAKQELKKLLSQKVDWPGGRLRLLDRGQGKLGLGVDIQAPGDEVVEYEGAEILLIGKDVTRSIKKITLDVDETPDGAELVISG